MLQDCNPPPSKKIRVEFLNNTKSKSYFENFLNIPGLQHLAENIFMSLNYGDLMSCQLINRSSKVILDNPMFWLKKFVRRGISRKNKMDWHKAIKLTRNTNLETNILFYLKRSFKHPRLVDFPCYIDENVVLKSLKIAQKIDVKNIISWNSLEAGFIQIFASLTKHPDRMWSYQWNPKYGEIEFIKSLAPLTENPNKIAWDIPNEDGNTLMHFAAILGRVDVIKYLVSLVDKPNIPNKNGETPIQIAAKQCYYKRSSDIATVIPSLEICSILTSSLRNSAANLSECQLWGIWKALEQMSNHCASLIKQLNEKISKLNKQKTILKGNFGHIILPEKIRSVPEEKKQETSIVLNVNRRIIHDYNVLKRFEELVLQMERKIEDKYHSKIGGNK